MLKKFIIAAIQFYRKHLSSKKGFRCAYGVATGRTTCSTVGLRAFSRGGVVMGWRLTQRQFDRCTLASHQLRSAPASAVAAGAATSQLSRGQCEQQRNQGAYRRFGALASQRGFVDAGSCDCDGCDVGSCDMGACDVGTCNAEALSCPTSTPVGPQGWFFYLMPDCSPGSDCDCGTSRTRRSADVENRADAAQQRVSRRAQKRQARRDEALQRKARAETGPADTGSDEVRPD